MQRNQGFEYISSLEEERETYDEVFNDQLEEFWDKSSCADQNGKRLVNQLILRQLACHPNLPDWQSKKNVEGATGGPSITFNSGKMQYLMTQIPPILEAGDSCILVSEWTSHLEIYEIFCKRMGWKTAKHVGKDLPSARQAVVRCFNQEDDKEDRPRELGAGAVGLNLIGANHLFLLDLHYNPQTEAQAFDRIHRVGQEKPVFIHRLCAVGTVEEDVLQRQKQKLEMASKILDGSDD